MAETSKVNHDHTYDILTSLINISPPSPEEKDLLFEMTSPEPSDTSSDSGLALSPMQFEGLDFDFADDTITSLNTFDLESFASSCSPESEEKPFYNIDDITDIDLSFLDGLDDKTLGNFSELCDNNMLLDDTDISQLESLMVDDGIVADLSTKEAEPLPSVVQPSSKTVHPVQIVKTTATITPIIITGIRPVLKVQPMKGMNYKDELVISEEEKKLLEEEGHELPTNVALTKEEEKLLKKVRRKIKNKVSAQESRRKKKDYVDGLESRVKNCTDQNRVLQKKVNSLEEQNKSLLEQLKTLQELVSTSNRTKKQTSTCILVLFLAFALVAFPFNSNSSSSLKESAVADSYATVPVRSRTLLQYNDETEAPSSAINISHYLRAFSVVFSFTKDKPEVRQTIQTSHPQPSSISFESTRNTYQDGGVQTNEYSFSK